MTALLVVAFIAAATVLASCVAGVGLGAAWQRRRREQELHPWALAAPKMFLAVPAAGFVTALASLVPSAPRTWFEGLCACEAFTGLHVCPFHFSEASVLLVLLVPAAAWLLMRRLAGVVAVWLRSRDLEHVVSAGRSGSDGIVPLDLGGRPLIFVAGLRRPRIVVERSWWASLDAREKAVISAHEQAHVEAGDPAVLALLDMMLHLVAPRWRAAIVRDWMLASEIRADAAAVAHDGDATFVAEVLCRYARSAAPAGALGLGGAELEARVHSLLDGGHPAPFSPWTTATCTAVLGAALVSGHLAHRLLETALHLLH